MYAFCNRISHERRSKYERFASCFHTFGTNPKFVSFAEGEQQFRISSSALSFWEFSDAPIQSTCHSIAYYILPIIVHSSQLKICSQQMHLLLMTLCSTKAVSLAVEALSGVGMNRAHMLDGSLICMSSLVRSELRKQGVFTKIPVQMVSLKTATLWYSIPGKASMSQWIGVTQNSKIG